MTQQSNNRRTLVSEKHRGMDLEFLSRVRRASIVTGAVLFVFVAVYIGLGAGAAWAAGIAWSLVNLHFIAELIKRVVTNRERSKRGIVAVLLIKFPALYGMGFLLLWMGPLPALWLVAGFTWPFVVLALKAFGRAYLRLDDSSIEERASRV
jgi:hypothetical protein